MAEFVVDVVLIVAVLVLLAAWALSAHRNRRRDQREHAAERRLILEALTHAAAPTVAADQRENVQPTNARGTGSESNPSAAPERLGTASITALLDLLEDRRPVARGILARLFSSPRTAWSAGTRAGQALGQRTTANQRDDRTGNDLATDLYRDAAAN